MKEHPILFNAEMVRAILNGRKTQSRRMVKPQPIPFNEKSPFTLQALKEHVGKPWMPVGGVFQDAWQKPFGVVGDRLWVRETWAECIGKVNPPADNTGIRYRATDENADVHKWRPSIHMPRWASRIDLEITAVRVERLREITEEDAKKEGVESVQYGNETYWKAYGKNPLPEGGELVATRAAAQSFRTLWQSIYGTWDANPFVWVYEFRRVKP